MNKIKQFFADIWGYLVLIGGAIVAILLWLLNVKNKQLEAAKAKLALANTQREVDIIETEIKAKLAAREITKSEREGLEQALDLLEKKRQSITDGRTDQEREDYWNKS